MPSHYHLVRESSMPYFRFVALSLLVLIQGCSDEFVQSERNPLVGVANALNSGSGAINDTLNPNRENPEREPR